jgi:hypothetical protein
MTFNRKLVIAMFAGAIAAGNVSYANRLQAQIAPPENGATKCNSVYCSSKHPEVCGSTCGCGVGFGSPQCWYL